MPAGIVTVSHHAAPELVARARDVAARCGLPFIEAADSFPRVVIERNGARLEMGDAVTRSHPGIGLVRLRRLIKESESDPLLDLAELSAGNTVLDATFGFGQDALILAHVAAKVVALEASPLLAALALAGMPFWSRPANEVSKRIELRCADLRTVLPSLPDRSFDLVYFDPMFRRARSAAPDFAVLRRVAEMAPLTPEDIVQARRIARRCVIVKDAFPGAELKRLGIPAIRSRRSAEIVFGRLPVP